MLALNILPEINKKNLRLNRILSKISGLFLLIFILTVGGGAILVSANLTLSSYLSKNNGLNIKFNQDNTQIYEKAVDLNKKIKTINEMQDSYLEISKIIKFISDNSFDDITYSSLNISLNDPTAFNIKGSSITRDSLLKLKQNLENSSMFSDLDFPLQNILEKNNIKFSINSKLKIDEIKQKQL